MIPTETIATGVNWGLISTIIMALATCGMWLDSRKARKTTLDQPVDVHLVKAMHEEFARKDDFEQMVRGNTERHSQLFKAIDRVERDARRELDERFVALAEERKETMGKLTDQITFISENIASINRELQIRNKK
jgi:uncharacterized protein YifE (UPF0438 family)